MNLKLISAIRQELKRAGDPVRAKGAQAYMKSSMPYHGVAAPELRRIYKSVFAAYPLQDVDDWRTTVLELWRGAKFREERYAAIALAGAKVYAGYQTLETLPLYEELIVDGAWWDFVDVLASHRLGLLLRKYPGAMRRKMLAWSRAANMWKRRSAILCQLSFKKDTDLELLYACIEPNLADKEFFIRKAIGWALRQYAWTDAKEIVRYVKKNEKRLSSLSKREALKNILTADA